MQAMEQLGHFQLYFRTFNSLATGLVDIAAVSMPIARSLNLRHLWHCVVYFIVDFYSAQYKVHLYNDHAI